MITLYGDEIKTVKRDTWQGYSAGTPHDTVRHLFAVRYGYEPSEVKDGKGLVLAGPIGVKPKRGEHPSKEMRQ